jgi:hypothetical protein
VEKFAGLITETDTSPDSEPENASPPPAAPSDESPPPEQSDTESPTPDEPAADELYEVKVDGSPVRVDLDELKAGYSRQEDYSRKARALADERRAFESESQNVQQDRDRYQQGLKQLTDALQSIQGEPDWDQLHKELPADEFLKRKADWEVSQSNLERLQRHQQEEARAADEARQQQYQKYLRAEQDKLKAAIPEWEDTAKAKAEGEQLVAVAKHYGFSEQEVRAVVDHRAILLLRDAMKYRELHREPSPQARAKVSTIRTAKPGTPDRPRPNERQQKLVERAAQTGRGMDAMKAIESLLPD